MGKRRGFFHFVRRLFSFSSSSSTSSPDPAPKQQHKENKRRWLFGKLSSSPALLPPLKARTLEEAEEQQSKHALAVAVATAAAAEAAVAAAQAAAEVVKLTGLPSSGFQNNQQSAAVRIQTAFRGYLARRALRALKGLVKLQALVRGRAVRRQTNIALKNLQSLIKIQTEARVTRMKMLHESLALEDKDRLYPRGAKDVAEVGTKLDPNKEKKWDCSPLSKEKANAMFVYRQEAALKRERALEYASSRRQGRRSASRRHSLPLDREPEEAEELNRRWSWLEQWVGNQPWDTTNNVRDIRPVPSPEDNPQHQQERVLKTVPDTDPHPQKRNSNTKEEQEFRPPLAMRRSFNRSRRGYIRDDESFTSSPAFPSYMQFTESAKARSRSISTPKQRFGATPEGVFPDNCTLLQSSSRHLSPFTSVCSDASVAKLASRASNNRYQKSPRLKAPPPVAAATPAAATLVPHRSSKDFSRKET